MKLQNTDSNSSNIRKKINDDLFLFSIRKITNDILLKEMKSSDDIKTIALVSSFEDDKSSEIADYLSYEFSSNGDKTLLISFRDDIFRYNYKSKIREISDEGIMKTGNTKLDFLSLDNIRRTREFDFDKDSIKCLLDTLKEKYKRIIIDTPPMEENLTGVIVAIASDGAYFICNSKSNRGSVIHKYYTDLKDVGVNIFGVIFNNTGKRMVRRIYKLDGRKNG
jgi:cellulose biosynthesis protein BcsQ